MLEPAAKRAKTDKKHDGYAVLQNMVNEWHSVMPLPVRHRFVTLLRELFGKQQTYTFGAACSGSDVVQHCVKRLLMHWHRRASMHLCVHPQSTKSVRVRRDS